MAITYTDNFNLSKDDEDTLYNVSRVNDNTDMIDSQLARVSIKKSVEGTSLTLADCTGPDVTATNNGTTAVSVTLTYGSITLAAVTIAAGESNTWQINSTDAVNVNITATGTVTVDYYAHNKTYIDAIANIKQDAETGKGLSANDLTDTLKSNYDAAYTHSTAASGNPHNVTKSDVGLSNVDNTADADKPISSAAQVALSARYTKTEADNKFANQIGSLELIEEFTINDSDIAVIERSAEPDEGSTPYNFKFIYITLDAPQGSANVAGNGYINGVKSTYAASIIANNAAYNTSMAANCLLGFMQVQGWNGASAGGNGYIRIIKDAFVNLDYTSITSFKFTLTGGNTFPTGTSVKIYAIK
ncbi:MAG: hypothetical protein Q4F95_07490 [Oscillospiraceae bacterium]|nr:hypothetical protein [Oscillospiraceae bacterium]